MVSVDTLASVGAQIALAELPWAPRNGSSLQANSRINRTKLMPLIRIDVIRGRDPSQLRALADTVHEVLVETFAAPPRDRYQIISQHEAGEMTLLDTGLGFERSTDGVVVIQVTEQGRTRDQ